MGQLELQDTFTPYFDRGDAIKVEVREPKPRMRHQRAKPAGAPLTDLSAGMTRKADLPAATTASSS